MFLGQALQKSCCTFRPIKLTLVSWKLKVKTNPGQNVDSIVTNLNSNPRVGSTFEEALPATAEASLYGGDNFVEPTPAPVAATYATTKASSAYKQTMVVAQQQLQYNSSSSIAVMVQQQHCRFLVVAVVV